MRNIEFVNGCFYHIYNRGVLKSKIFYDNSDYVRFVHYLYEFNNALPVLHISRKIKDDNILIIEQNREALVDVICWCIMPNHFHLIVRQRAEDGIRRFMRKIETGHAMSINKKYNRSGVVFEGRFKAKIIEEDEHLMHLSGYIHLNPLDLAKEGASADRFLDNYRWSSYLDYTGKHNFPSILNKEPLSWYFKNPENHKKFDFDLIEHLIIE